MIQNNLLLEAAAITYPESDGLPMADNSRQLRWMVVLFGNLSALFRTQRVFVGANHFWYPVENHPEDRIAPDVFVVFDRPKGDRPSYQQWKEDHIPVSVAFEILSPGNTIIEMADKLFFYDQHGVQEYYVFDPESNGLLVYLRTDGRTLVRERVKDTFVSPLLGIRFDLTGPEMVVFYPDGRRFLSFEDMEVEREREQQQRLAAEQRANLAEQNADLAGQRANLAEQTADRTQQRLARLAELGRKARRNQANEAELAELERLEEEASG